MRLYAMLMFDWDDAVLGTHMIRAGSVSDARTTADLLVRATQPQAAGFQLWRQGKRVFSSFPQQDHASPGSHGDLAHAGDVPVAVSH
jgi:hypothetical protein